MKNILILFLIYINFVICINKKIICSVDKVSTKAGIIRENKRVKFNSENKRKTSVEDEYNSIRIYFSTNFIKKTIQVLNDVSHITHYNITLLNRIYFYLNNTKSYIENLIQVKRQREKITVSSIEQKEITKKEEKDYFDTSLYDGISADLVIFPIYEGVNTLSIQNYKRDEETNRVLVSALIIPIDYLNDSSISQFEVESLLLHELTHILGFQYESYQYFPGGLDSVVREEEDSNGKKRYYIKTQTVIQKAKDYYGCGSLIGLELENQENLDVPSSHWESRILLGEYMNLEQYTPEVVISDFTLALLEDSGWYKVNYYTGGLMRFGKNKGCDFINNNCPTDFGESSFKNEFFGNSDNNNPSCSSGRLSRTYCLTQYYSNNDFHGTGGLYKNADHCYTFYYRQEEEKIQQYIGNCKIGKGDYGSMIQYNNINLKNGDLEDILGEVYSEKSFCVLSEVYDINNDTTKNFEGIIHPICYEMFCSDTTLTIKIKEQYIACPRQGGKVQVTNNMNFDLKGYIYCPDYNLICTGEVLCNDMFD